MKCTYFPAPGPGAKGTPAIAERETVIGKRMKMRKLWIKLTVEPLAKSPDPQVIARILFSGGHCDR
jgi:hypothetical protein